MASQQPNPSISFHSSVPASLSAPAAADTGRRALLSAALDLFTRKGYDSTSVEDLRKAAGFKSKASLYAHFSSKEAVSEALMAHIFEQMECVILQAYSTAGTEPLEVLTTTLKTFIRWGLTHRQEYSFRFIRNQQDKLLSGQFDYAKNQLSAAYARSLDLVQQLRQRYPVRAIADPALISMVLGLISRAVLDHDSFGSIDLDDKVDQVVELCMGVLFSESVSL